jgi:hypothetical protein
MKMIQLRLNNTNWLRNNEYSSDEEGEIYERQLCDILTNTRWYLDNLEFLVEYRVSWVNYRRCNITKPKHL